MFNVHSSDIATMHQNFFTLICCAVLKLYLMISTFFNKSKTVYLVKRVRTRFIYPYLNIFHIFILKSSFPSSQTFPKFFFPWVDSCTRLIVMHCKVRWRGGVVGFRWIYGI